MKAAGEVERVSAGREGLWLEFNRALAGRNFVRAVALAGELKLDELRVRRIQLDALRQFIAEYQNFDGAGRLCAEYCITADELAALAEELIGQKQSEAQPTLALQGGRAAYLSIAEQIRSFAQRQTAVLRQREGSRGRSGWWKRATSAVRSWFDRLSALWRGGGFPHGGLA
ncbi:MAG TPA: hypothetical protein VNQ79_24795 [Blastocatellia bacterium]|nr:hypothetical protein [Blastocatellia bacterium]